MGALTSKLNSFKQRPWDYLQKRSFDLSDPLLPRIRIDEYNQNHELRVLPIYSFIGNAIRVSALSYQESKNLLKRFSFKKYNLKPLKTYAVNPSTLVKSMYRKNRVNTLFLDSNSFYFMLEQQNPIKINQINANLHNHNNLLLQQEFNHYDVYSLWDIHLRHESPILSNYMEHSEEYSEKSFVSLSKTNHIKEVNHTINSASFIISLLHAKLENNALNTIFLQALSTIVLNIKQTIIKVVTIAPVYINNQLYKNHSIILKNSKKLDNCYSYHTNEGLRLYFENPSKTLDLFRTIIIISCMFMLIFISSSNTY